jgi:hypothetical protein
MDTIRQSYEYAKRHYGGLSADHSYADGGYILGGPVLTTLGPDECLIRMTREAQTRLRCCRSSHPTPTSDCGRPDATIEPPEPPPSD